VELMSSSVEAARKKLETLTKEITHDKNEIEKLLFES
jgi:hypothetical protein